MPTVLGLLAAALLLPAAPTHPKAPPSPAAIALPGAHGRVHLDDVRYLPALGKLVVPAGGTGHVDLVDPATLKVRALPDGSGGKTVGRREGTSSVALAGHLLLLGDHTHQAAIVLDPRTGRILARTGLAGGSDYLRYAPSVHELWITEPRQGRIEVLAFHPGPRPRLTHAAFIDVAGGPESLVFDPARGVAYTNTWTTETVTIDLKTHRVVARWNNGCEKARGLERHGDRLFVACREGRVALFDLAHGHRRLGQVKVAPGVDIVAYDPARRHLYVPSAGPGTLTVVAVAKDGTMKAVRQVNTAPHAHCVTTDGHRAFVCDPLAGRILVVDDP